MSQRSLQNSPLESSFVVVAFLEYYSTSKPLKSSLEKSQILSCDTVVANERYIDTQAEALEQKPAACHHTAPTLTQAEAHLNLTQHFFSSLTISITKTNQLMLLSETASVCCKNRIKQEHKYAVWHSGETLVQCF